MRGRMPPMAKPGVDEVDGRGDDVGGFSRADEIAPGVPETPAILSFLLGFGVLGGRVMRAENLATSGGGGWCTGGAGEGASPKSRIPPAKPGVGDAIRSAMGLKILK